MPPGSMSSLSTRMALPLGPHHCARLSLSVHAFHTASRDASKVRVMVNSQSSKGLDFAAAGIGNSFSLSQSPQGRMGGSLSDSGVRFFLGFFLGLATLSGDTGGHAKWAFIFRRLGRLAVLHE